MIERIVKTDISLIMSVDIIKVIESASRTNSVGYRGSTIFLALKLIFVKLKVYLSKGFR